MGLETIQFARTKNAKTHNKPFTKTQATNNASSTLVQSQINMSASNVAKHKTRLNK